MSHKHQHLLEAIFTDPPTGNLHWRDVESLLAHLGAETSYHGARLRVVLNRVEFFLHHPHHGSTCSKQDVKQLREGLARAGVTPSTHAG